MIEKIVNYPWGEQSIFYDSFVYKEIDEDANKVLDEVWVKDDSEYTIIQERFNILKDTYKSYNNKIIEYNTDCFEYFMDADDNLGIIKVRDGKGIKSRHRILVYIQGFLK